MALTYSDIEILNDVYVDSAHALRTTGSGTSGGGGGDASAANQTTEIAKLTSIDGKIPSSPATDRSTAAAPFATRLSDGSAFYKATTPSDTQPVSITGTLLQDADPIPSGIRVGAVLLARNGSTLDIVRVQTTRVDLSSVSIASIATVWTPTTGKKFRLMGGSISVSVAGSVLFEDNSAGAGNFVWRTPKLSADTPYNFDLGNGKLSATTNNVLKATSSVASGTIIGTLYGTEE